MPKEPLMLRATSTSPMSSASFNVCRPERIDLSTCPMSSSATVFSLISQQRVESAGRMASALSMRFIAACLLPPAFSSAAVSSSSYALYGPVLLYPCPHDKNKGIMAEIKRAKQILCLLMAQSNMVSEYLAPYLHLFQYSIRLARGTPMRTSASRSARASSLRLSSMRMLARFRR